jgi:hypothetical protein
MAAMAPAAFSAVRRSIRVECAPAFSDESSGLGITSPMVIVRLVMEFELSKISWGVKNPG